MAFALHAACGLANAFALALDNDHASSGAIGASGEFLEEHVIDLV
jgi:hypothetical protein